MSEVCILNDCLNHEKEVFLTQKTINSTKSNRIQTVFLRNEIVTLDATRTNTKNFNKNSEAGCKAEEDEGGRG